MTPLGSPLGTTSAASVNQETGEVYGPSFPTITPVDQVGTAHTPPRTHTVPPSHPNAPQARCHMHALRSLGLPVSDTSPLHAVVGGSMGGMQALAFACLYPGSVDRLVALSCTARTSPVRWGNVEGVVLVGRGG